MDGRKYTGVGPVKERLRAIAVGVFAILGGICCIVLASLLVGYVPWGIRWVINAIGWMTIAVVVIPFCEEIINSK